MIKITKILIVILAVTTFVGISIVGFIYSREFFLEKESVSKGETGKVVQKTEEEKALDDIYYDIQTSNGLDSDELDSLSYELDQIDLSGI